MMGKPVHRVMEESLLTACVNLGKNLIQQCLQQEVLPSDGTEDVLSGACLALAEVILQSVQLRICEDGRVTQKEILTHACRELAMLIKAQCPRGPGEMVRMQGELEWVLSESSLAAKLAQVINTRELVECVCSQHKAGLGTVLLSACQWLMNDIKALFLCEEVWSNFFGDEYLVRAALYTQIRPLLSTTVFQIITGSHVEAGKHRKTDIKGGGKQARGGKRNTLETDKQNIRDRKVWGNNSLSNERERQLKQKTNHSKNFSASNIETTRREKDMKDTNYNQKYSKACKMKEKVKYCPDFHIVVNNRSHEISYIIEIISTERMQDCYASVWNLWRLLTRNALCSCNDLCDERRCYLVTFGRHPVDSVELLPMGRCGDSDFNTDVMVQGLGGPVWPKDKSVVKRWFPGRRDQAMEEYGDCGNQCLQIWRVDSRKIEKRRPKTMCDAVVEKEDLSVRSTPGGSRMEQKSTCGCFHFHKAKRDPDGI